MASEPAIESAFPSDEREAGVLFSALFDAAPFSMQVFDAEGRCVYANQAWSNIWGPPPQAVLGYNILNDPQLEGTELARLIRRAYAGEALSIPPVYYDPADTPGNPEGKARWCAADMSPVKGADGQVNWLLVRHEDVTLQVNSAEKLRHSELHLRQAQAVAHTGSWELDLESGALWWSDEVYRIFEIDSERFGASYEAFLEIVHPDDREKLDAAYSRHLEEDIPYDLVHRLRFVEADGSERIKYVHERCQTERDSAGKPLRSIGTVQDVTEQIAREKELEQARKRYQALVDNLTQNVYIKDHCCPVKDLVARK